MLMSSNSLDSKMSPHSRHSTNSASSSRLTICTRGCLQGCWLVPLGIFKGGFEVINPKVLPSSAEEGHSFAGISRYCRTGSSLVKSLLGENCAKFFARPERPGGLREAQVGK